MTIPSSCTGVFFGLCSLILIAVTAVLMLSAVSVFARWAQPDRLRQRQHIEIEALNAQLARNCTVQFTAEGGFRLVEGIQPALSERRLEDLPFWNTVADESGYPRSFTGNRAPGDRLG